MLAALIILTAYLIGSVSSAIVVCKLAGLPDPRAAGSKNPGATNVLRIAGKGPAAAALAGDIIKGWAGVMLAVMTDAQAAVVAGAGLAAFLGHLYPLYFRFRGGKGVATALGVLLGISPALAGATLLTWLAVAAVVRISSLAALTAAVLAPVYAWWLVPHPPGVVLTLAMSLMLLWRHRPNIRNLLAGTEPRIGQKEPPRSE